MRFNGAEAQRARRRSGAAVALIALLAAGAAYAQAPVSQPAPATGCRLVKLGDLELVERGGRFYTPVSTNGVAMLFRLGGGSLFANGDTLKRWQLRVTQGGYIGAANGSRELGVAMADQLTVGGVFVYRNARIFIDLETPADQPDIGGALGAEVFSQVDVEYDLKNGRISIFTSEGCEKAPLAYWSREWSETALIDSPGSDAVMATIGGKPVTTVLTLAGGASYVRASSARDLKLPLASNAAPPEALPPQNGLPTTLVAYESFELGGETIRNPKITTVEESRVVRVPGRSGRLDETTVARNAPDLVLAADFFRAHRVFVSHRQKKIYFTYNGGPVFSRPAPASPK